MSESKMFRIDYYTEGKGRVYIPAEDEQEAKDKFHSGEFDPKDDKEWSETVSFDSVLLSTKVLTF